MKVIVECDCGSKMVLEVETNKYAQLRDNLYYRGFQIDEFKYNDGKVQEFSIICSNCKSSIVLGVD